MTTREIIANAPAGASQEAIDDYLDGACGGDAALRREVLALMGGGTGAETVPWRGSGQEDQPVGLAVPTPPAEESGPTIAGYRLLERIGAGGFGDVYAAEQLEPVRRRVALKVIKPGMDTREVVARFETERQALALMDHPNIAQVYGAGVTGAGRPFFAMELVRGVPVTRFCDEQKLGTRQRLELFIDICGAVQHAHQKGVIHRDLKPSNVLVSLSNDLPAVKVIDFGIAKATQGGLTDLTLFTRSDQVIGTPAYMSPEQVRSGGLDIDTRSDIYSLGVMLYELLCGMTPFDAAELAKSGHQGFRRTILEDEPAKPSKRLSSLSGAGLTELSAHRSTDPKKLKSQLRGDLDWIVMKAMEKDRAWRYETANGLAMDIRRHLANKPVEAAAPTLTYQLGKFARRHRAALLAGSTAAFALVAGGAFSIRQAIEAGAARDEAETALQRAAAGELRALEGERRQRLIAYAADMKVAEIALGENNFGRVSELLDRYLPAPGEDDLRGIVWRYLWQASSGDSIHTFEMGSMVNSIALSDDGSRLAAASFAGPVRLFDVDARRLLHEFDGRPSVLNNCPAVALSPDGRLLAAERDTVLTVWDADSGTVVFEWPDTRAPLAFSPDSETLVGAVGKLLTAWDTRTWESRELGEISKLWNAVIAFTPDGSRMLLRDDLKIRVWDLRRGNAEWEIDSSEGFDVLTIAASDRLVAAGSGDGQVQVWDLVSGETRGDPFQAHPGFAFGIALSPDGKTLATGGNDQLIHLWDTETLTRTRSLKGHGDEVWSLRFSKSGRVLASGSKDRTVKLWRLDGRSDGPSVTGIPENLIYRGMTASGGSLRFAERTELGNGLVFDPPLGEPGAENRLVADHVLDLATGRWSRVPLGDGEALAGATSMTRQDGLDLYLFGKDDGTIVLSGSQNPVSFKVSERPVRPHHLSRSGRYLVVNLLGETPDGEHRAVLWDRQTGQAIFTLPHGIPYNIHGMSQTAVISPDERFFAYIGVGDDRYAIGLWNIPENRHWATLEGHSWEIGTLASSPDGHLLASAGWEPECRVWDVESGTVGTPHILRGHKSGVNSVGFSSDSRVLSTQAGDETQKFWSLATGQELLSRETTQEFPAMTASGSHLIRGLKDNAGGRQIEVTALPTLAEIDREEERF